MNLLLCFVGTKKCWKRNLRLDCTNNNKFQVKAPKTSRQKSLKESLADRRILQLATQNSHVFVISSLNCSFTHSRLNFKSTKKCWKRNLRLDCTNNNKFQVKAPKTSRQKSLKESLADRRILQLATQNSHVFVISSLNCSFTHSRLNFKSDLPVEFEILQHSIREKKYLCRPCVCMSGRGPGPFANQSII